MRRGSQHLRIHRFKSVGQSEPTFEKFLLRVSSNMNEPRKLIDSSVLGKLWCRYEPRSSLSLVINKLRHRRHPMEETNDEVVKPY